METITTAVADGVRGYAHSIILGGYPPPVSPSEKTLLRPVRCRLNQLRSSHCVLNNYRARIDPTVADIRPDCGIGPHNVQDLFNCRAKPTQLSPQPRLLNDKTKTNVSYHNNICHLGNSFRFYFQKHGSTFAVEAPKDGKTSLFKLKSKELELLSDLVTTFSCIIISHYDFYLQFYLL